MAITVTVTPGKQFSATERMSVAKLNQLGQPTFAITGTVGTTDITDASLTPIKMIPGAYFYTGSVAFANPTYTLSSYPSAPVLANGLELWFKASADNVATVSIDATGVAKKLFKYKTEALQIGDIRTNQIVGMRYDTNGDGGSGAWQMISHLATQMLYYDDAPTGTPNAPVLALGPAPVAYADLKGKLVAFKQGATANSGTMTVQVNAIAAPPAVKKFGNVDMASGEVKAGEVVVLMFDGTNWQVQNALSTTLTSGSEITVVGSSRNLVITANAIAGQVVVVSDDLVLKTLGASPLSILRTSPGQTFTIDISGGGTGANTFDVAAVTPNWYAVYAIYGASVGLAGLLSLSTTTPTLPANYTYCALLGFVRCPTGITVNTMYQVNRTVFLPETVITSALAAGANNTYEILAGARLTNFQTGIPPTAKTVSGIFGGSTTGGGFAIAACKSDGTLDSSGTQIGVSLMNVPLAAVSLDSWQTASMFRVPVRGTPVAYSTLNTASPYNIQWKTDNTANLSRIYATSYEI